MEIEIKKTLRGTFIPGRVYRPSHKEDLYILTTNHTMVSLKDGSVVSRKDDEGWILVPNAKVVVE